MISKILLIVVTIMFISCNNSSFKTKEELLIFLKNEENGYLQNKSINGVEYSLMYKPTDLMVLQELGEDRNEDRVDSLRKKYKNYMYFNLSISKNNNDLLSSTTYNTNDFASMVSRLTFGMKKKVQLTTQKKDTIEIVDYVYPRMYGMSKKTNILFVFNKEKKNLNTDYLHFTVGDMGLLTGEVKFKIDTKIIMKNSLISF